MANTLDKIAQIARERMKRAENERLDAEMPRLDDIMPFHKLEVGGIFAFFFRRHFPQYPQGPFLKLTEKTYRLAADENAEVIEIGSPGLRVERAKLSSDGN